MVTASELRQLLTLVQFDTRLNCTEGLEAFRELRRDDPDGTVVRFLNRELPRLEGQRRGGVAWVLAEHYLQSGDLASLQKLFSDEDPDVKSNVLNALWGDPGSAPVVGPGIVQLAIDATGHSSPEVRSAACSVIQNQCAWKVDVSNAVAPLLRLLSDDSDQVRMQAACAVGNLAKRKYDLSEHVVPLGHNVRSQDASVRNYSSLALWQISRSNQDIGAAIPELVQLLTDEEDWKAPRKNALGALLHHARKTPDNRQQVLCCLQAVELDPTCKQIQQFQKQLAEMH